MNSMTFISYSHADRQWMTAVRKHLRGALLGECRVFTDEDMRPGATWEKVLLGSIRQAKTALVLASPDFLESAWCRRELSLLHKARATNQLSAVYWLMVRQCVWQLSELAELQAVHESATTAIEDLPAGPLRDGHLVRACSRIASDLRRFVDVDPKLTFVRDILARSEEGAEWTPLALVDTPGDFSVVSRGVNKDAEDVVIKVVTNTPLHKLRDLFLKVSDARKGVIDPTVIEVKKVFAVGEGYDQRIVILSRFARGGTLASLLSDESKRAKYLSPEQVGVILRRLAEALAALHKLAPIHDDTSGVKDYVHVMGPLAPSNVFFDEYSGRPQISLVGVTNFLWQFFDPATFRRMVNPSSGNYVLPEKSNEVQAVAAPLEVGSAPADDTLVVDKREEARLLQCADQYFLGMLALELLEGRQLFLEQPDGAAAKPSDELERCTAAHSRWTRSDQLVDLIKGLLKKDPKDRFETMEDVVDKLRELEDSKRVLAKYSYRRLVVRECRGQRGQPTEQPEVASVAAFNFSCDFYAMFFHKVPAAAELFKTIDVGTMRLPRLHHDKLIDSLQAVLNYRTSNPPTSIDVVVKKHLELGKPFHPEYFRAFKNSFIATLRTRIVEDEELKDEESDIVAAWESLFVPVIAILQSKLDAADVARRAY